MGHKTKWCQKSDVWSIDLMQSCLTLCHLTDRTVHGYSRPEYWSRWPFPSSGDFPNPGIEPRSSALQADFLPAELLGKPRFNQFHYKPQWAFFFGRNWQPFKIYMEMQRIQHKQSFVFFKGRLTRLYFKATEIKGEVLVNWGPQRPMNQKSSEVGPQTHSKLIFSWGWNLVGEG